MFEATENVRLSIREVLDDIEVTKWSIRFFFLLKIQILILDFILPTLS